MSAIASDYRKIIQIAAPFAVALLVISASHATSQAETAQAATLQARNASAAASVKPGHMLVIPASDGYGFDDCLSANKACGHVIADAWCEAHGLSASISFGKAEDITASVADGKPTAKIEPNSFVVSCRD